MPFTLSVSQDHRAGFDPYNNERLDQSDVGVKKIQPFLASSQHPPHIGNQRIAPPRYLCSPQQGKIFINGQAERKIQLLNHQVDKMKLTKYGFRRKFLGFSTFLSVLGIVVSYIGIFGAIAAFVLGSQFVSGEKYVGDEEIMTNLEAMIKYVGDEEIMTNLEAMIKYVGDGEILTNLEATIKYVGVEEIMTNLEAMISYVGDGEIMTNLEAMIKYVGDEEILTNLEARIKYVGVEEIMTNLEEMIKYVRDEEIMTNLEAMIKYVGDGEIMTNLEAMIKYVRDEEILNNLEARIKYVGVEKIMTNIEAMIKYLRDEEIITNLKAMIKCVGDGEVMTNLEAIIKYVGDETIMTNLKAMMIYYIIGGVLFILMIPYLIMWIFLKIKTNKQDIPGIEKIGTVYSYVSGVLEIIVSITLIIFSIIDLCGHHPLLGLDIGFIIGSAIYLIFNCLKIHGIRVENNKLLGTYLGFRYTLFVLYMIALIILCVLNGLPRQWPYCHPPQHQCGQGEYCQDRKSNKNFLIKCQKLIKQLTSPSTNSPKFKAYFPDTYKRSMSDIEWLVTLSHPIQFPVESITEVQSPYFQIGILVYYILQLRFNLKCISKSKLTATQVLVYLVECLSSPDAEVAKLPPEKEN